ncbi:COG4223 family protein [Aestuariivirga sp.]|uniref:COG4223 family protein n=1 Tax=Aestuariivirga sp. TaxID=2650926 RepID=UPI0035B0AAB6
MSNQHDDSGSRPQVIDLEAEEIRSEGEAAAASPEETVEEPAPAYAPPPPPRKSLGAATWIIAALILGALGGGFLYRGVLSSYLPSNEMVALRNQVAALEQNNSDLAGQIAAVKQGAEGAAQAAASATDAAAQAADAANSAAAQIADVGTRLDQTDQQQAALEEAIKAARGDLDALRKSMSSAPAAAASGGSTNTADAAVLAALGQRIDALEKDVASLKSGAGAASQAGSTAALSQALADLKAKVAAGTSFQAEYERIARMVPAASGLDVVAADAAEGVPDAKGLAAALRAAIPTLPKPEAPPAEDDSYFGTLMTSLSGIISIRPIGDTDWPQVAEKAAAFADANDLTQAIATIDGAEGDKPMVLTQWRDRAAARLTLEAALAQVSDAVLRQIAATGGAAQ